MDAEQKPVWKTPELIVLVRNKPEEVILNACKSRSHTAEVGNHDSFCDDPVEPHSCSNRCNVQSDS